MRVKVALIIIDYLKVMLWDLPMSCLPFFLYLLLTPVVLDYLVSLIAMITSTVAINKFIRQVLSFAPVQRYLHLWQTVILFATQPIAASVHEYGICL